MDATTEKINQIESVCATDVGRNINELAKVVAGNLFLAAESLINHLNPKVAIVTGFYIPQSDPPAPETDGIPGAVVLAKALDQLGIPVNLITDNRCSQALNYAVSLLGKHRQIRVVAVSNTSSRTDIKKLSKQWHQEQHQFTHIVYIERAGPSDSGSCLNMSGKNIDKWTAPLHELMTTNPSFVSIGIGDGGNEIGMGKIPFKIIRDNIINGSQVACVIPCDFLIVAGVSNWGANALLLAMAVMKPNWQKTILDIIESDVEYEILCQLTKKKLLVDGVTKRFEPTVDGFKSSYHHKIYHQMIQIAMPYKYSLTNI
ncbi:MAG: DUF4392 domain-containing protein [Deltaproteobacteria bacterium]|jgi:D-glutamate cyclase|nr:DUF4392 domain-containing protein [Deltaproteobacteria bacterium]MBT4525904.1 DUF4392 domain-containing protein [Deltaproteobacteria bacterium]